MQLKLYMFIFPVALFFFSMGIIGLIRPAAIPRLFKTALTSPEGRNEIRAVYGGYGLAVGALLVHSITQPHTQSGVFLAVGVAMLGMAFGRIVSLLIERRIGLFPLVFLVVELLIALILLRM